MSLVAVTVIGNDRPGIVAGVTKVLFELGCNLEVVSSTILRGHFSMVLVVRAPDEAEAPTIEERLGTVAEELGLVVAARPVDDSDVDVPPATHMISVYGADQPGIVFHVAETLARHGVNITDLTSRVIGSEEQPVYALMLEVSTTDPSKIESDLAALRDQLAVDASVHAIETDVL